MLITHSSEHENVRPSLQGYAAPSQQQYAPVGSQAPPYGATVVNSSAAPLIQGSGVQGGGNRFAAPPQQQQQQQQQVAPLQQGQGQYIPQPVQQYVPQPVQQQVSRCLRGAKGKRGGMYGGSLRLVCVRRCRSGSPGVSPRAQDMKHALVL